MINKLRLKKFLIAGGNSTLLAWNCPLNQRKNLIKKYLGSVEQIGFVKDNQLTMMGNELCINATIALASQLQNKEKLYTSGLDTEVNFENSKDGLTSIEIKIPITRIENIILLSGIGFLVTNEKTKITKKRLSKLANKFNLPAFGIAIYNNSCIEPYVYVKQTNSLSRETACGSASIATNIVMGINKIIQPTGKLIYIENKKNIIKVSAKVVALDC